MNAVQILVERETQKAINVSEDDIETLSSRANFLILSADCVSRESCPRFSINEWHLLCQSANGTIWTYERGPFNVMDSFVQKIAESGTTYGVNPIALTNRFHTFTFTEVFSVFEVVLRFCSAPPERAIAGETFAEKIERLGGRVNYDE